MSDYRRNFRLGGTFFFTLATHRRVRMLTRPKALALLRKCLREERERRPFDILAAVVLPDHLHMIWRLPPGDADFSIRWSAIKGNFTRRWLAAGGATLDVSASSIKERRQGVWQRRFMEHTLRDEDDMIHHVEYMHYNPVKHRYVDYPKDWRWSSFHLYVRRGIYSETWCCRPQSAAPNLDRVDEALLE